MAAKLRNGGKLGPNCLLITKGLVEFWKANQNSLGDSIFDYVKESVMQIHIFRGGDNGCSVVLLPLKLKVLYSETENQRLGLENSLIQQIQMAGRKPVEPSPKKQTFFKVLSDDFSEFSQHLRIPPQFVKNFKGKSLRKCALRGPSGTWDVELERRENGLFFHDHGWQGFVEDHVLEVGDFLVFSYDGKSNFDVTIFDPSCCEKDVEAAKRRSAGRPVSSTNKGKARAKKEIVDSETENYNTDCESEMRIADKRSRNHVMSEKRHEKGRVEETSDGSMVFKSEFSCFIATMKKHMQYRVMIPKGIAVAEGLMRKKSVILEDPTGSSRIVKLQYSGESDHNRLLMTNGWVECCKANQISHEDTVVFEFVKQGVIQIHIFKAGDKRCPVALAAAPDLKN